MAKKPATVVFEDEKTQYKTTYSGRSFDFGAFNATLSPGELTKSKCDWIVENHPHMMEKSAKPGKKDADKE